MIRYCCDITTYHISSHHMFFGFKLHTVGIFILKCFWDTTPQPTVLGCPDVLLLWRTIWWFGHSVRRISNWYIIQGVEVAVYRRMELKWTLVDHGRTDLESYWLTNSPSSSSSQIDSYLEKTIRAISPARLQSDNINSYKYSIKF